VAGEKFAEANEVTVPESRMKAVLIVCFDAYGTIHNTDERGGE
jgi:hypothetical protein